MSTEQKQSENINKQSGDSRQNKHRIIFSLDSNCMNTNLQTNQCFGECSTGLVSVKAGDTNLISQHRSGWSELWLVSALSSTFTSTPRHYITAYAKTFIITGRHTYKHIYK